MGIYYSLFLLYHCKWNVFEFWTPVRQNKRFEDNTLGYVNLVVVSLLFDILEPKQLDQMKKNLTDPKSIVISSKSSASLVIYTIKYTLNNKIVKLLLT